MTCPGCNNHALFDAAIARRDLKRFHRRGADAPTRQLIAAVRSASLPKQPTLLDVGGGVGTIHHILLDHGFVRATHVDGSPDYLAAAAGEAERLGHKERVQFTHADFPSVAATIAPVDVVTLNRVVCCDPDYERMLRAAAGCARHLVAFSYPRPRPLVRLVVSLGNWFQRVRGKDFRSFLHPPAAMAAVLEALGLRRRWSGGTWVWAIEVFERV